ncbi:hypothetical protein [Chromobacterium alticapitis]|uniref:hypothetical protein n=1 Tax=Chromobacterium alticapitis TaxID=2073169 RepID=UPI0011B0AE0E|nr:hypothetical protein [Chromobacterium alticapitis]
MGEIKDLLAFFQYLINGFVAAWIFFGLTSFSRASPFERVAHALVLTAVVSFFSWFFEISFLWFGRNIFSVGEWGPDRKIALSFVIAVCVGLFLAYSANNDLIHQFLRKLKIK